MLYIKTCIICTHFFVLVRSNYIPLKRSKAIFTSPTVGLSCGSPIQHFKTKSQWMSSIPAGRSGRAPLYLLKATRRSAFVSLNGILPERVYVKIPSVGYGPLRDIEIYLEHNTPKRINVALKCQHGNALLARLSPVFFGVILPRQKFRCSPPQCTTNGRAPIRSSFELGSNTR